MGQSLAYTKLWVPPVNPNLEEGEELEFLDVPIPFELPPERRPVELEAPELTRFLTPEVPKGSIDGESGASQSDTGSVSSKAVTGHTPLSTAGLIHSP